MQSMHDYKKIFLLIETLNRETNLNSILLHANTIEKGKNPSPPSSYGLNSRTFIWKKYCYSQKLVNTHKKIFLESKICFSFK